MTLQTFSSAVELFKKKKKYCIFWSCDDTFLILVLQRYLAWGNRQVPLHSDCGGFHWQPSLSVKHLPQRVRNPTLSFEERSLRRLDALKPGKSNKCTMQSSTFLSKSQHWLQQNHNSKVWEGRELE